MADGACRSSGSAARAGGRQTTDREVQARFAGTAWTRCDSWYRDSSGRIVANWPGYMREYETPTRVFDPAEYKLIALLDREPVMV